MKREKNDVLSAPCEVAIEVTGRCNLNCKYCFNDSKDVDIPYSKLLNLIDQIDEMEVFEVCFTGGEPFIREDFLEILEYSSKKNFSILIVTNGTLLTKEKIERLDEMNLISSLQISVDSSNADIHNYVRGKHQIIVNVLKEIKKISSSLPTIGLVLHKHNFNDVCSSLDKLSEYCSGFHLMNLQASKKALEYKQDLFLDTNILAKIWNDVDNFCKKNSINIDIHDYDLKKKETARFTGCTAGKTKVVITPELNVLPCDMVRDIILGNLVNQSLADVWKSKKMDEIRNLEIEPCYFLNEEWYKNSKLDVCYK